MSELLPCPFCGGEAATSITVTESLFSHDTVTYTSVGCDECDMHFSSEPGFEVEALEQWNTRTALASSAPATGDDKGLVESIGYLLATVDAHADKFPVPSHMRNHVQFIRQRLAALSSAPATGERDQIVAWLREQAETDEPFGLINDYDARWALRHSADAIARGDHRTQSGEMEGGEHG